MLTGARSSALTDRVLTEAAQRDGLLSAHHEDFNSLYCRRDERPSSVYSTMSATQLSHPFDSFESQRKSSIPAFLHMRMADLVPTN